MRTRDLHYCKELGTCVGCLCMLISKYAACLQSILIRYVACHDGHRIIYSTVLSACMCMCTCENVCDIRRANGLIHINITILSAELYRLLIQV